MASNQPSHIVELEESLICSMCLDILKSPKTLCCTHSFCEECLKKCVDIEKVDGTEGRHCPLCKTFSKSEEFIDTYHLQDLLELYWKCKKGILPSCFICESEKNKVIWKCTDCKITLCEGCQRVHNKLPNCKTHHCEPYSADSEQAIDEIYYCESHSDQIMDFYCTECQKIICLKCKCTSHIHHRTETIQNTTTSITKDIKKSLEIVRKHITELHDENTRLTEQVDTIENEHAKQVKECKTIKQELVSEIEKWETETLAVLNEAKQENIKNVQEAMEVNKRQITIKESISKLTTVTLSSVKGCSLVTTLTDNFRSRLAQEEVVTHTKVDLTHPQRNKPVVSHMTQTVEESPPQQESPSGVQPFHSMERIFDVNFTEVMAMKIDASFSSKKLYDYPYQICLIEDDIWIGGNCEYSGDFYIFHTSSETIEHFCLHHEVCVRTFCQISDNEVIAACRTGLVVLQIWGNPVLKISEYHFKDLCTSNGKLFAIEAGTEIFSIFELQNGMWEHIQEISMDYHFGGDDTMITDHSYLYICVKGRSKILKYSFEGKLLKEFGSKGTDKGQFRMPSVCGIDKYGNLLVCDSNNHRIQVMTTDYNWHVYPTSEVKYPNDILIHNDIVYVLRGRKQNRKLLWKKVPKPQLVKDT